jgi:hypothetical protein
MATDLRDGLRLCRLAELLTGASCGIRPLRMSAASHLCGSGWLPAFNGSSGSLFSFVISFPSCCCTGHPRFFDTARFPSDRRPVRLANLQLALNQFARAGLPPQRLLSRQQQGARQQVLAGDGGSLSAPTAAPVLLAASDLVDGDREMTLCLLWHLILHFQLPQVTLSAALLCCTGLTVWILSQPACLLANLFVLNETRRHALSCAC